MSSWREIERIRKDAHGFRALCVRLLAAYGDDLNEWESEFLEVNAGRNYVDEFSVRQGETLLNIRDGVEMVETFRGFSIRSLLAGCHQARVDLSEDDERWIDAAYCINSDKIRRRHASRLFKCARQLGLVEEEEFA